MFAGFDLAEYSSVFVSGSLGPDTKNITSQLLNHTYNDFNEITKTQICSSGVFEGEGPNWDGRVTGSKQPLGHSEK